MGNWKMDHHVVTATLFYHWHCTLLAKLTTPFYMIHLWGVGERIHQPWLPLIYLGHVLAGWGLLRWWENRQKELLLPPWMLLGLMRQQGLPEEEIQNYLQGVRGWKVVLAHAFWGMVTALWLGGGIALLRLFFNLDHPWTMLWVYLYGFTLVAILIGILAARTQGDMVHHILEMEPPRTPTTNCP